VIKVKNIFNIINSEMPFRTSESWDNTGLLVGDMEQEIQKVLISLEFTQDVLNEAIEKNIDLIITHHPVIFGKITRFTRQSNLLLFEAMKNNISIICAHTNADKRFYKDFFPDVLRSYVKRLDLFDAVDAEKLYKIVVFVPEKDTENVRKAMFDKGAGHIGEYSKCSFNVSGIGTFTPQEGTDPHIGEIGKDEEVKEIRVETICKETNLNSVIDQMIKEHPYEEVAYDVYELKRKGDKSGFGVLTSLKEEMSLLEIAKLLKNDYPMIKISGNKDKKIKKLVYCNGSGASMLRKATRIKADLFISGDLKYHDAQESLKDGLCLIDIGHYGTEKVFMNLMYDFLNSKETLDKIDLKISDKMGPVYWSV